MCQPAPLTPPPPRRPRPQSRPPAAPSASGPTAQTARGGSRAATAARTRSGKPRLPDCLRRDRLATACRRSRGLRVVRPGKQSTRTRGGTEDNRLCTTPGFRRPEDRTWRLPRRGRAARSDDPVVPLPRGSGRKSDATAIASGQRRADRALRLAVRAGVESFDATVVPFMQGMLLPKKCRKRPGCTNAQLRTRPLPAVVGPSARAVGDAGDLERRTTAAAISSIRPAVRSIGPRWVEPELDSLVRRGSVLGFENHRSPPSVPWRAGTGHFRAAREDARPAGREADRSARGAHEHSLPHPARIQLLQEGRRGAQRSACHLRGPPENSKPWLLEA